MSQYKLYFNSGRALKSKNSFCLCLHRCPSLRVAASACGTLLGMESTKSNELYFSVLLGACFNAIQHCIKCGVGACFATFCFGSDGFNEFFFVHGRFILYALQEHVKPRGHFFEKSSLYFTCYSGTVAFIMILFDCKSIKINALYKKSPAPLFLMSPCVSPAYFPFSSVVKELSTRSGVGF